MKRRILLVMLLVCVFLHVPAQAAETMDTWADAGNYTAPTHFNSTTKEITINTAAELGWVSAMVASGQTFDGYTIYLGSDIDLSGHLWQPIGEWNSSGIDVSTYFSGTFDGQGHRIQNMTVEPGLTSSGFFGCIVGAVVKNVKIVDCVIAGAADYNSSAGGLVAVARYDYSVGRTNVIRGCGVSGVVAGGYYTGGIVGLGDSIERCLVFSSYADCTVTDQSGMGRDYALGKTADFYNCWYNADKCANAANTDEYYPAALTDCYGITASTLETTDYVTLLNTRLTEDAPDWTAGEGGWPTLTSTFSRAWCNNTTPVTEQDGVYYISTAGELAYIAKLVNSGESLSGKTVKLMADIDLGGKCWTPIGADGEYNGGYFAGSFDGNGKTIKNLTITPDVHRQIGLFGYVKEGSIKNVTLQSPVIDAGNGWYCGGVVAETFYTEISSCHVTDCSIESSYEYGSVGGIGSYIHGNGSVTDCSVTGEIRSAGAVGGILCSYSGEGIERCSFNGTILAEGSAAGILCGFGEMAGIKDLRISQCFVGGSVTGGALAGGIIAPANARMNYFNISISDCYITGDVTSSTGRAGGIAGNINIVSSACSIMIENCYATGNVSGASDSAVLIGSGAPTVDFTVTNCYWNKGASLTILGLPVTAVGMGGTDTTKPLTLDQMKSSANFTGFDFSTVWAISADKNGGIPYLRWQTATIDEVQPVAMTLDVTSLTLNAGSSRWLIPSFAPVNASGEVVWSSSDPSVATVSMGQVLAHTDGSATITATCGKLTATCVVTVTARPSNPYVLGQLRLTGEDGREVGKIPVGSFWVTVPLMKNEVNDDALVVIATYTADGAYQGMFAMKGGVSVGETAEFSVLIDNADGRIGEVRAFVLASLAAPIPLCADVSSQ